MFSLTYDFHAGNGDNGNVYGITNNRDASRNQAFTYDALNRLLSAQNAGTDCTQKTVNGATKYWGNSYGYDPWGDLINKTPTKCSAENLSVTALANNQLSGYGYDAAGNMIHDSTTSNNYNYDAENRITGAAGFTYTYDVDGNRVEKSNGSTGTIYWPMSPGIVAESDLKGNLTSEYVFFGGKRVARKDFPGGAVSYYFSDHLGTASVITNAAGTITEDEDFSPWGLDLPFVNSDPNKYKFTGKEQDGETGLYNYGARFYSPALSRFITPDWSKTPVPVPYADLNDPQTLCQYCYVRGLPTTKVDADGHGFFTKLKNFFTDGGFNEDAEAQQERARRQHQRADDARKSLSGMKGFTINGQSPADFAKGANDQQAIAGSKLANDFVLEMAGRSFFCPLGVSCGIVFPVGDSVNLTDTQGATHILDGDATGGGHRGAQGFPARASSPQAGAMKKSCMKYLILPLTLPPQERGME